MSAGHVLGMYQRVESSPPHFGLLDDFLGFDKIVDHWSSHCAHSIRLQVDATEHPAMTNMTFG